MAVFVTSGNAETAIFSGGKVEDLYSQSPIALLIAITPSTRPSSTLCPAARTLDLSYGKSGL